MSVFKKFADRVQSGYTAESNEAQALVKEMQNYMSVIICKLLGCERCKDYFDLTLDGKPLL